MALPTVTAAHDQVQHNEHVNAKWSSVMHAVRMSILAMHIKAGYAAATGEQALQ